MRQHAKLLALVDVDGANGALFHVDGGARVDSAGGHHGFQSILRACGSVALASVRCRFARWSGKGLRSGEGVAVDQCRVGTAVAGRIRCSVNRLRRWAE